MKLLLNEIKILFSFLLPIWITQLFEYSLNVASVVTLSHLGTIELAVTSLCSLTAVITGIGIIQGFATGLDSLLATSYSSANPQLCGLWSCRMFILISILLIPISTIWLNAESLLLFLGQDPQIAHLSGVYLRYYVFSLPGYTAFEILRKFLQSSDFLHVPTMVLMTVAPINMLLQYLLVYGPEYVRFGFIGSPIASAFCINLIAISLLLYIIFNPSTRNKTWSGFSSLAFRDLDICWRLGSSATIMTISEWFAWEGLAFAASFISPTALAAQSVINTTSSSTYQLPSALSVAVSVRVGNLLGEQKSENLSITTKAALTASNIIALINSLIFIVFRKDIGRLFTHDEEVIKLVSKIIPLVCFFQFTDGNISSMLGILRTTGRQLSGAIIQIAGFYVIGLPLALTFAFLTSVDVNNYWPLPTSENDRLIGLWLGMSIALVVNLITVIYIIHNINWEKECEDADVRIKGTTFVPDLIPNERQSLLDHP